MSTTDILDIDTAIESSFPTTEEPEIKTEEGKTAGDKDEKAGKNEEKTEREDDAKVEDADQDAKKEDDKTGETPDKKAVKPEEKKPDRVGKRIDELLKQRYELRQELAELRKKVKSDEPEPPKKPDPKDYTFDPKNPDSVKEAQRKFDFDMGKYQAELKSHEEKIESRAKESDAEEKKRIAGEQAEYAERIEEGKKAYPDYDAAFKNIADSFEMTEALHIALLESKDPAGILWFLGKNPLLAENILSMNTTRQAIKLAEIDVKLAYAKERKIKKVSNAPAPPAKVEGGGGGKKDPSKMSAQEYFDTYFRKKQT